MLNGHYLLKLMLPKQPAFLYIYGVISYQLNIFIKSVSDHRLSFVLLQIFCRIFYHILHALKYISLLSGLCATFTISSLNSIIDESTRVCLQPIRGVDGSDYINASFIDVSNNFITHTSPNIYDPCDKCYYFAVYVTFVL